MRIYTSDENEVLIKKVVEEVAEKACLNPRENYSVIVPEKFSVSMERLILEKSKTRAFLNVQVVTLSRLLYKLIPSTNNYLSKIMGIMATKKVILENYDNLVCYKKTAKTMGFAENIYNTISELKNSKVKPEDYYKKNKTGTSLDIKLHDIFLLYKAYEDFLKKEDLVDASDRFDLLTSKIYESEYIKNSHIYVLGYDSTTRSGFSVFEAIAKCAKSFTAFCIDNTGKGNSYICPPEMLNNYLEIATNLGVKPVVLKLINSKLSIGKHIANNMYAYPYSRVQIGDEIALIEAVSVLDELSMVAEDIRRKIIEKGLRFRDFSVVCSGLGEIQDLIKMVFSEYDIPFFLDTTKKLSEHPFSAFIENALNAIRKNYSVEEFLAVASNIVSGIDASDYAKLENYVVKFGLNYDDFKKPFKYQTKDNEELKCAENVRLLLVTKLEKIAKLIKKAETAVEYNKAIEKLMEEFEADLKLEDLSATLTKLNKLELRDATKQVKSKIEELLNGANKIFGTTKITFDEYFAVLQSGLNSETISLIPVTVDNVFVGDISTSKFFGSKEMYVVGAVDGVVPLVKDDCGIIDDRELEMISSTIGKKIEPTIKTINAREKFKLVSLLQDFSGHLTVSYSRLGRTGEEQRPSSLVRELAKIFYRQDKTLPLEVVTKERKNRLWGLMREDQKIDGCAFEFSTKEVATQKLLKNIRLKKLGISESGTQVQFDSLKEVLEKNKGIKNLLDSCLEKKPKVELNIANELYFTGGKTSVSQLECYFSCPFKFFATFGLRLKSRDEAELKSVDYGNVLHKIAELYVENIKKFEIDSGKPLEEKAKEIESLINFVFNQEKLQTANNKYMLLQLKKEAFRLIDAITYQYRESNFKPVAQELVFGKNGKVKGVYLTPNISIEGKIDRVDAFKNFYRVIDYKTGHIDLSPKTTYYGQKVQLFAYLLAMQQQKGMKPAGAFYLPIRNVFVDESEGTNISTYKLQGFFNDNIDVIKNMDRRISPERPKSDIVNLSVSSSKEARESNLIVATGNNALTEEQLNGVTEYTKQVCKTAVNEILEGFIKPTPLELDGRVACDYCEYKTACGRDFNGSQDVRKEKKNIKLDNFIVIKENEGGKTD